MNQKEAGLMENRFMSAKEVAEYLGVSESKAYKIIQMLNSELRAKGYITIYMDDL